MWPAAKSLTIVILPPAVEDGSMLPIPKGFCTAHFPCNEVNAPRYCRCKAAGSYGPRTWSLGGPSHMGPCSLASTPRMYNPHPAFNAGVSAGLYVHSVMAHSPVSKSCCWALKLRNLRYISGEAGPVPRF